MKMIDIESLDYEELLRGSREYVKREKRDAMYKVATFLVDHFWFRPADITDGIGVLLLVWNQAFYRYCNFALDFEILEAWLMKNENILKEVRNRDISSLSAEDKKMVKSLFDEMLDALICGNRKSPVAVSKALHLLAPSFFPIWDNDISKAYDCYWEDSNLASSTYLAFMEKMKDLSQRIVETYMNKNNVDRYVSTSAICREASTNMPFVKSLLKIIDEYNYAMTKYQRARGECGDRYNKKTIKTRANVKSGNK
jgi:hypothetical protein